MTRWVGSFALLALFASSTALAQERETARREFEEASRQYEQGHFALALRRFERAYELMQSDPRGPLILYNIGRSQEALGRFEDALRSFERYLADAPSDAPYRDSTVDLVRDLRARIPERGGADTAPPSTPPATGGLGALDIAGLAVGAVGAVTALTAIPTGTVALDGRARLDRECSNAMVCAPGLQTVIDETRTMALVTDVLWIAGVSALAVGATLLAIGRATAAPVTGAAFCTEDGCVGRIQASF